MLNVHDLERRWLRYKIKSYIPYALASLGGITVLIALSFFLPSSPIIEKEVIAVQTIQTPQVAKKEVTPTENEVPALSIDVPKNTDYSYNEAFAEPEVIHSKQKESLVLRPSLHFMDNIEESISPYIEDDYIKQEVRSVDNRNFVRNEYIEVPKVREEVKVKPKPKKSTLKITRHKEQNDLKDVIRRFKKNKNPALSLFIAKRYYADGKYQKSYNYALMTNEIDKNIDESWIIFAKSLVKLGQHELASNTLKSYLKTTKSSAADVLLRKIEGGTFR